MKGFQTLVLFQLFNFISCLSPIYNTFAPSRLLFSPSFIFKAKPPNSVLSFIKFFSLKSSMFSLSYFHLHHLKCTSNFTSSVNSRPSRTNTEKRCPFHYRRLEYQSRKPRNTWSNRLVWPRSTEWSRAKANRVLPRECIGHSKHPLPTTQEKTLHMDITRWSKPTSDWLYSLQSKMEKLYTVSKNKTGRWLWLKSWVPYCQIQI